ncbi:NAD(P)/FAD-dependent oxidoreductase [soil metagenome]
MATGRRRTCVIIGGGFGGLSAAKRLRNSNVDVILIDKTNHYLFQPLLYQVATAALSPGDVAQPIRSILRRSTNIHVLMQTVLHIDTTERLIVHDGGVISYDHLILAPGARHSYFGHPEWEAAAPGLKDLNDALLIRERLLTTFEKAERDRDLTARRRALTFVIVGAGPTGVELAGAIAEISTKTMLPDFPALRREDVRVLLVDAGPRVLTAFTEGLSAKALASLQDLGVEVQLSTPVTDVRADGVQIGDEFIYSTNVIWAAGNQASPILRDLDVPLDRQGRVFVNDDCTIPGHDDVYVIGDAANLRDLPGVAQVAMQQGSYAATIIKDNVAAGSRKPFRYRDLGSMATIGRARAVAQVFGLSFSGFLAWALWAAIHIASLIGFRNRFKVMIEWLWFYMSFQPGARLIVHREIVTNERPSEQQA